MFSLKFEILEISHFGFEGGDLVLIASLPGHCLPFTSYGLMVPLMYNHKLCYVLSMCCLFYHNTARNTARGKGWSGFSNFHLVFEKLIGPLVVWHSFVGLQEGFAQLCKSALYYSCNTSIQLKPLELHYFNVKLEFTI